MYYLARNTKDRFSRDEVHRQSVIMHNNLLQDITNRSSGKNSATVMCGCIPSQAMNASEVL